MIRKTLLIVLFSLFIASPAYSRKGEETTLSTIQARKTWMEEVRKFKFELFTKELGLTKEQQDAFFPLYEEKEKAIFKISKEADSLLKKIAEDKSVTDTEYESAALAITKSKLKKGEVEMEYFAKFEKILSKKQLFLLKKAEESFSQAILNHHRGTAK